MSMGYKNKEDRDAYNHLYYSIHRDAILQQHKEYHVTHLQERAEYGKLHRVIHAPKIAETHRRYYQKVTKPDKLENPGKYANGSVKKLYGVTAEWKESMWLEQDKKCAICYREVPLWGRDGAHIDHDHVTGAVRSLLCAGCNRNVAAFESSLYEATKEYVNKWRLFDKLEPVDNQERDEPQEEAHPQDRPT